MSLVRQFLQDRAGNFGLAFALSAIPIMVAVGLRSITVTH